MGIARLAERQIESQGYKGVDYFFRKSANKFTVSLVTIGINLGVSWCISMYLGDNGVNAWCSLVQYTGLWVTVGALRGALYKRPVHLGNSGSTAISACCTWVTVGALR